jgi:hypothetical protein
MADRELKLDLPKCGHCGALTRVKFSAGRGARGKSARSQHSGWRVCGNGHQVRVKRG